MKIALKLVIPLLISSPVWAQNRMILPMGNNYIITSPYGPSTVAIPFGNGYTVVPPGGPCGRFQPLPAGNGYGYYQPPEEPPEVQDVEQEPSDN